MSGEEKERDHEQVWKKSGRPAFDGRPVRRPAGRLRRRAGGRRHPDGPRWRAAPPPVAGWRPSAWRGAPTGASQIPICTSPAAPARPRCAWCTAACWRRTRPGDVPLAGGALSPWTATTTPSPSIADAQFQDGAPPHHRRRGLHPGLLSGAPPGVQLPGGWGTAIWWTTIRWWMSRPSPSP